MISNIKDLAKIAGVSKSTVSRALSNHPSIRTETRQKILKLAQQYNFAPNSLARGLITKRTLTIGLVVGNLTNPYYTEIVRGVQEMAAQTGYNIILGNSAEESAKEEECVKVLAEKKIDGLVITPVSPTSKYFPWLDEINIPYILIDRRITESDAGFVTCDNLRGGYLATEHLIKLGQRRIGYIGGADGISASVDRFQGYRQALADYGLDFDPALVVEGIPNFESGFHLIKRLAELPQPPTAVFAINDMVALGVLEGLRELGLKNPQDIALVGYDDIYLAKFYGLTTVSQAIYQQGQTATRILLESIESKAKRYHQKIVFQPQLTIRKTCGADIRM